MKYDRATTNNTATHTYIHHERERERERLSGAALTWAAIYVKRQDNT